MRKTYGIRGASSDQFSEMARLVKSVLDRVDARDLDDAVYPAFDPSDTRGRAITRLRRVYHWLSPTSKAHRFPTPRNE